jgi:hypothetical protein
LDSFNREYTDIPEVSGGGTPAGTDSEALHLFAVFESEVPVFEGFPGVEWLKLYM